MGESISVAILAGGQSLRMGANKALVRVGGRPIIERIIERVEPLGDELVIITNTPADFAYLDLPVHTDLIPGKSTLGGVYTAIAKTRHDHTLVVSCDAPFLNPDLLCYLIGLRHGFDAVVPLNREGYPQSLHTVYGKACLDPIHRRIIADRLRVIGFFPDVRIREVTPAEIDPFDPERLSFVNVNTPEDLEAARGIAARVG